MARDRRISYAPKDKTILVYVEEFDVYGAAWWPACWSYINKCWVIKTPLVSQGRAVTIYDFPQPKYWQHLPPKPIGE